jgi:hypothetical protein
MDKIKYKKTIAFDFDGVIHRYSKGWQDGKIYDDVLDGWVELVKSLHKENFNVIILTTRNKRQVFKFLWDKYHMYFAMKPNANTDDDFSSDFAFRVMPFYEKFFNSKKDHKDYKNKTVGICNHKAVFDVLIDDRAICFTGSYNGLKDKITNFKSWV